MSVVFDRTPPASRHIKIFDMSTYEVRFSQELHESMTYTAASEQFHTFEAQSCIVGLSFTDVLEAQEFMTKVKTMLPTTPATPSTSSAPNPRKKPGFFSKLGHLFKPSDGPMSIGMPTDFVHKQHIGYDPEHGFQSTDIPPEWVSIFKNAGIRRRDLEDPELAAVIYSTLQSQLGGDAPHLPPGLSVHTQGMGGYGQQTGSSHPHLPHQPQPHSPQPPSPTVPARPPGRSLTGRTGAGVSPLAGQRRMSEDRPAPPPLGSSPSHEQIDASSESPPPPPPLSQLTPPASQAGPPPPPPHPAFHYNQSPPPPPLSSVPPPPPPMSGNDASPPPPPPPAPLGPPPPPAPPAPPAPPSFASAIPPPPPPSLSVPPAAPVLEQKSPSPPPVLDHLAMIKSGITLKKVQKPQANDALPDVSQLNKEEATTLTSVLQNAMKARLKNIQAVEDDEADDDGWD